VTVGRDPATVSTGAGSLFFAPIGTAEWTTLSGPMTGFVDLGYTEKGVIFTVGMTTADIDVAEEFYPLATTVLSKTGKLDFALSQLTAQNLSVANAGGTITTPSGYVTFEPPAAGTEARLMLAWQSASGDERYLWRRCFQTGASATARQKALPQALLPVSFNLEKPAGAQPWKWWGSTARSGA